MKWDLQLIGVPVAYREINPYALSETERLDAYPELANPKHISVWMSISTGNVQERIDSAWDKFIHSFVLGCERLGSPPFILDTSRRNLNEEIRSFLLLRRKRVRDYIDPLGLVTLPIFRSSRKYTRYENSWWLRSQARIIKRIDGLAIGSDLQLRFKWLRTTCPEYRGSQSWHKWLQPGVVRVGWSSSTTECWFWYELRCPHLPGVEGHYRLLDDASFIKQTDALWLPIVKNLRWWSTSNLRTRDL